jgi:hypothetical protein
MALKIFSIIFDCIGLGFMLVALIVVYNKSGKDGK